GQEPTGSASRAVRRQRRLARWLARGFGDPHWPGSCRPLHFNSHDNGIAGHYNPQKPKVHACCPSPSVRSCRMPAKPKVFVTRRIPDAGLIPIREHCDAEIWADLLPPPYDLIRAKIANCDGLVSLLTDRIDAALLDAAPR